MITFESVSKSYQSPKGRKTILKDCSFSLKQGQSLAVLGENGVGKSTFLRLISGAESPDSGRIKRGDLRISWPLGLQTGFQSSLTGRDNLRFVARLYGSDTKQITDYVEEFTRLGTYLDMPVKTYSSGMRARLAFGLSMAIDFDLYLIDEIIAVGDAAFKAKSLAVFREKAGRADIIMVSHSKQTLNDFCNCSVQLNNGDLIFHSTLSQGVKFYEQESIT